MDGKLVLVDGHSILNRAFFGIPDLTNSEGLHTNAVYGFLNILFKILDEEQPDYLTVAFDVHAPTFRHKMYDAYKGTRKPMAEELRQQVPLMKEMLTAMGVTIVEKEGYEADDLLGTIAKQSEAQGLEVSIVSGDRDLLQLASDHIKIRIPKTKRTGTEIEDYLAKDVVEKYQVTPLQFIDVKALMGDSADNIPGVPGIGEKTATALIVSYGSIENAHDHLEEIKPNRAKQNLSEHYDMAQMSKELATIEIHAPIEYSLEDAKLDNLFTEEAYLMCKRLEFKNMLSRFDIDAPKNLAEEHFTFVTDKKQISDIFKKAKKAGHIGCCLLPGEGIITEQLSLFDTLRQLDGISGFPKRHESDTDSFDTGHSSTSISAALGMAMANKLNNNNNKVVAVIGDGALTGGMALEALNNVASLGKNFVIILNDNNMSISQNVGSMSNYLNKLRVGEHYNYLKEDVETSLSKIPKIGKKIVKKVKKTKDNIKNFIIPGGLFDDLGITYIGPVNGHDINGMISIFKNALKIDHPIVIHVKTTKGKGYLPAQNNPSKFHGIGKFDVETGEEVKSSSAGTMSYTEVFSRTLVKLAKKNKKILAITAAMPDGTGLSRFQKEYPDRFFDVGIAEEHAVTFAAGLATSGYKPVVSIYSSFYQRAYDQILHDVCLQNLPVVMIVDRAGLVGQDGETHQGIFDVSFMSAIPNLTIIAPKDTKELIESVKFAMEYNGPIAIRFPRGTAYVAEKKTASPVELGKSEIVNDGYNIAIIAVGNMFEEVEKAYNLLMKENINPTIVNARFIKPLDKDMIEYVAKRHKQIIVVEEAIKKGGYGEAVSTYVQENCLDCNVKIMAIEDCFVEQGLVDELREKIGISSKKIYEKVKELV